ncbi:hypothetical protein T5B8_00400 [Salinisphaera sp. T5B8]|uniref:hypothetical protein n=1 Tax=Salinisphaera sp. T5B8 TaxID=1304154 RepID=UPI003341BB11
MKRINPTLAGAGALIFVIAMAVPPVWAQAAGAPPPDAGTNHAGQGTHHAPSRHGYGYPAPELEIYMAPENERWPSNYLPDNYRLHGYDGEPDRATVCSGESGRTYATRTIECPDGQQAEKPGRSWSTAP